ncbi:MAG: PAS domain-containing protein, partial [Candidatus Kapaibacterium sp.]
SIDSGKLIWDEAMYGIFGYEVNKEVNYDDYKNVLHPDDVDRVENTLKNVINTPGIEFKSTFRIVKNNTIRYLRAVSKAYRDDSGKASKIVGLNWDVTEEMELKERYDFILKSNNMGVWDWDIITDTLVWNDVMFEIFGVDINDKVKSLADFNKTIHPDDSEKLVNEINHAINTPDTEFTSTFRIIRNDGTVRYIRAVSKAHRDENGKAFRAVGLNWDITK